MKKTLDERIIRLRRAARPAADLAGIMASLTDADLESIINGTADPELTARLDGIKTGLFAGMTAADLGKIIYNLEQTT